MTTINETSGMNVFTITAGSGTHVIKDFGGVGKRTKPSLCTLKEVDTLEFIGEGLTSENMYLTQNGNDLEITFEGVENTKVILQNFSLENLDNHSRGIGNVKFDGDLEIQDSFDVFNANSRRRRVFKPNTVTFLNDLDNNVRGFRNSNDIINAQEGDDTVKGRSGDDILRGNEGNDQLFGNRGDDILQGDQGVDLLNGGQGIDTATYESTNNGIFLFLGGEVVFNDGYGNQEMITNIENVIGSNFNDGIGGNDGDNHLNGLNGDDLVVGRMGADILTGGEGFDQFDYNNPLEGGDTITDFEPNERIRVTTDGFGGGLEEGILSHERFVLATEALNSDQRFIYDGSTGNLFFDVDGNGVAAQQHIALLVGAPAISAANIFAGPASPII